MRRPSLPRHVEGRLKLFSSRVITYEVAFADDRVSRNTEVYFGWTVRRETEPSGFVQNR